jgi:hypothetical protein
LEQHDLFGKPESTFPDHALWTNEYARSRQRSERNFRRSSAHRDGCSDSASQNITATMKKFGITRGRSIGGDPARLRLIALAQSMEDFDPLCDKDHVE